MVGCKKVDKFKKEFSERWKNWERWILGMFQKEANSTFLLLLVCCLEKRRMFLSVCILSDAWGEKSMMCSSFAQPYPCLINWEAHLWAKKGNGEACIFDFGKHVCFHFMSGQKNTDTWGVCFTKICFLIKCWIFIAFWYIRTSWGFAGLRFDTFFFYKTLQKLDLPRMIIFLQVNLQACLHKKGYA